MAARRRCEPDQDERGERHEEGSRRADIHAEMHEGRGECGPHMAAHDAMHVLVEGERPAGFHDDAEGGEEHDEQRGQTDLPGDCPLRSP